MLEDITSEEKTILSTLISISFRPLIGYIKFRYRSLLYK